MHFGNMKILIVEDEAKTGAYLCKGLSENGFLVDQAEDGNTGIDLVLSTRYDLAILDVGLPQCSGWTILKRMRDTGIQTPVVFLTARDSVQDRVKGLNLGADDYLIKPFSFSELLARIRSVLRRGQPHPDEILHIGDLRVDPLRRSVVRAGHAIHLSQKEFGLLSLLARHAGETISRTLIAEQVWNMNFDSSTNVVDVAIRRLRCKVDDSFETKLIHTVRGMGYVLEER